jgi:8-oxo-dGTP pyrophosphatase MutT (NUDIX family)
MAGETSWILDVRRRLAAHPARQPLVAEPDRRAVLVPLQVDAGELWTTLVQPAAARAGGGDEPAFPGGAIRADEEAWAAAVRGAAAQAGVDPRTVLRLGELDDLESPAGGLVAPCVGALPRGAETRPGPGVAEIFRVPLSAFANPRMVEEREVAFADGIRRVRAYHLGNRLIWGVAAHILEDLLDRLR